MSEQIDWSKAPEGATHYNPQCGDWYMVDSDCVSYWSYSHRNWLESAHWNARRAFCIARPTSPSWSGEGLPPVGVVCEVKQMARCAEREWFKAEVLYSSHYTVVLDDYQAGEFVSHPCTLQFRPIRTPEQIAADEREAAIKEMAGVVKTQFSFGWVFEKLYDAGYRKP